jgi:hypothetical protein
LLYVAEVDPVDLTHRAIPVAFGVPTSGDASESNVEEPSQQPTLRRDRFTPWWSPPPLRAGGPPCRLRTICLPVKAPGISPVPSQTWPRGLVPRPWPLDGDAVVVADPSRSIGRGLLLSESVGQSVAGQLEQARAGPRTVDGVAVADLDWLLVTARWNASQLVESSSAELDSPEHERPRCHRRQTVVTSGSGSTSDRGSPRSSRRRPAAPPRVIVGAVTRSHPSHVIRRVRAQAFGWPSVH